jgi:hypothetical protein
VKCSRCGLQAIVTELKDKAEDIAARIERLKGSRDKSKQDER